MARHQDDFELLHLRELADDLAVDRRLAFGLQHRLVEVEQHLRVERDLLHLRGGAGAGAGGGRRRRRAAAAGAGGASATFNGATGSGGASNLYVTGR